MEGAEKRSRRECRDLGSRNMVQLLFVGKSIETATNILFLCSDVQITVDDASCYIHSAIPGLKATTFRTDNITAEFYTGIVGNREPSIRGASFQNINLAFSLVFLFSVNHITLAFPFYEVVTKDKTIPAIGIFKICQGHIFSACIFNCARYNDRFTSSFYAAARRINTIIDVFRERIVCTYSTVTTQGIIEFQSRD